MELNDANIFEEEAGLYRIISLNIFRRTAGVYFDNVPTGAFSKISAIDRVIHLSNAVSPGRVGNVERPWYMHPHQEDNLLILQGKRNVELYTKKHGKVEHFVVTPEYIEKNGKTVFEGAAMLCWPNLVFHRVMSPEEGSSAINFAVHHKEIDMRTNFNIYSLAPDTGEFHLIRQGYLDQP